MQGVSAGLRWDPSVVEILSTASCGFIESLNGIAISPGPAKLDGALLGVGAQGITGQGDFATVTFRGLANGDPHIAIDRAIARDSTNHPVTLATGTVAVPAAPLRTWLAPAAPNPFHRTTALSFELAQGGPVDLAIYSVDGRRVRSLIHGIRDAGQYRLAWDGRDDQGQTLSPGVFYLHFVTPQRRETRAITYLK